MKRWVRLSALLLACIILGFPGFTDAKKTLLVGSDIDFPPYADIDEEGRSRGFAVELFAAVAEVMDIPDGSADARADRLSERADKN
jgi:ABC-type amino acid transport substrate-binding protein